MPRAWLYNGIVVYTVKAAWNKPAYFAERMHLAMKVKLEAWGLFIYKIYLLNKIKWNVIWNFVTFWIMITECITIFEYTVSQKNNNNITTTTPPPNTSVLFLFLLL